MMDAKEPKTLADALAHTATIGGSRSVLYRGMTVLVPLRDLLSSRSAAPPPPLLAAARGWTRCSARLCAGAPYTGLNTVVCLILNTSSTNGMRGAQVAEGADNNEEIDTEIFEFTGSYAESRRAASS